MIRKYVFEPMEFEELRADIETSDKDEVSDSSDDIVLDDDDDDDDDFDDDDDEKDTEEVVIPTDD